MHKGPRAAHWMGREGATRFRGDMYTAQEAQDNIQVHRMHFPALVSVNHCSQMPVLGATQKIWTAHAPQLCISTISQHYADEESPERTTVPANSLLQQTISVPRRWWTGHLQGSPKPFCQTTYYSPKTIFSASTGLHQDIKLGQTDYRSTH